MPTRKIGHFTKQHTEVLNQVCARTIKGTDAVLRRALKLLERCTRNGVSHVIIIEDDKVIDITNVHVWREQRTDYHLDRERRRKR